MEWIRIGMKETNGMGVRMNGMELDKNRIERKDTIEIESNQSGRLERNK